MNELVQRRGTDHDPIRPWCWGTLVLRGDPVEVVSYPVPPETPTGKVDRHGLDHGYTLVVRMLPGDPTSIREVPLRHVACFDPSRHEWGQRPRRYYGDNPTAYHFTDGEGS